TYVLTGSVGEVHGPDAQRWVTFGFFNVTTNQWIGSGALVGDPGTSRFERAPTEASAVLVVTTTTRIALKIDQEDDILQDTTISGGPPANFDLFSDEDLTRAVVT